MSEEQLKAFIAKVQSDTSLEEKIKAATDSNTVVAIAKETGFDISTNDLTELQADSELEAASGGANNFEPPMMTTCNQFNQGIVSANVNVN